MVNKFGVDPGTAGDIPSILPFGTMLLTPLFGYVYDKIGNKIPHSNSTFEYLHILIKD